ncbi:MAG: class I SAM-dependent methyltransferase [Microcoleus sp.]
MSNIVEQDENLILCVDESWSDDYAIGIRGWIVSKKGSLEQVEICVGDTCVPITSWHPRPDIAIALPQYYNEKCGFVVHLNRTAQHNATFFAKVQGGISSKTIAFAGSRPPEPDRNIFPEGAGIHGEFMQLVNDKHLRVLEIGSRIVSPGTVSHRQLLSGAASYTGFDYYPDTNTDVVGDAHKLSQYFPNRRFDAVFSMSVLEHLAMPWVAAMEINKVLEIGGFTFHHTHFSWPSHEIPWDFWRFTDEGLKALFTPALGFEVIKAAFHEPMRLHFDHLRPSQERFPVTPVFGGVVILAKKVAEINCEKFRWDVTLEDVLIPGSHYPKPNN